MMVAKVRVRLAVSKNKLHRCHMQTFNLKKFNEVEEKDKYSDEASNWFPASEHLERLTWIMLGKREYQNVNQRESRILLREE
jgi:hypothetical protein